MLKAAKPEPVALFICVTCQQADARPGALLYRRLEDMLNGRAVRLYPVECMSICKRPCTVAVSSPGKWSYIIGGIDEAVDAPALLDYLDAYAASESGTPPLKKRPAVIRRGTIARLPPHTHKESYAAS
ncbi:MAG: DUF1636 domain-containing protein [Pseudomonadota bacterium]|nr:DUF1636 domain-containing protein [Pseudomonadota bacterium]MDE3038385.1 DUF1636 domain-containing protein [Pseudomonadota bacterium]